jgi:hypothetical protein
MKPILLFSTLLLSILVWSFAIYGAIGLFKGW